MSDIQNKDQPKLASSNLFPVVGIGASAGGLEAFKRLIRAIPEDSGMAYILVQHLEPTHESLLTEILQKITPIPVQEVTNNIRVEPNHIYIIPSNRLLTATDGVLQLSPRLPRTERNMPIDLFFSSLAEVHQGHAIGIVLSGTATDGTLGLKAIKDHGGITFAQEQQSAAFDGMPQSAIDADVVDFILAPEDIPSQLAALQQTFKTGLPSDKAALQLVKENAFRQLLALLRVRKGVDFTYYKQTTIRRRIIRRMGLNKIDNLSHYLTYVRENVSEQDILYNDLLIPVTAFFRDPKIYEHLLKNVFPRLLADRNEAVPLRIWIAGCSTGEEPYSMAICLNEQLKDNTADVKIQIFATDISEKSIAKARSGLYTKRELAGISADRLQKYFTKVNGSFLINKSIRDLCVFACHNFLKDPPFAKMDFVSCRNVLIYMEAFLQKRALTTFHYALKENGYLLLGKSETTGPAAELFAVAEKSEKLYIRKSVPGRFLHPVADRSEKSQDKHLPLEKEARRDDFQKSADDILLARYTPPGVVVNEQMDIVQFRGATGTWLEAPPGKPSLNVLKMAREGLSFELRNAVHKARARNEALVKENIPIQFMGKRQLVSIEVIPLANTAEPHFLILFREAAVLTVGSKAKKNSSAADRQNQQILENDHIRRLENELAQAREDSRSITEDQEAINEELQSANEELLSGSEELQSLNEELETSKEELQSTNEELTTLNQELFDRNEQLNLSRIYAESIIATIREPLLVLDRHMQVKTANRSYYSKFKVTEANTEGKPFFTLENGQWNIPELRLMLENSLSEEKRVAGFEIKQTFNVIGEKTLLLNASRIFQKDNTEELILLAIEDITDAKKLETELKAFTYTLEKQVGERTFSLKEANASLQHSNENLEQFATIASHDLQEPLRKIRTFANLLNHRHSAEIAGEAKELLKKISVSAERMSALITGVLNFSKVLDSESSFESTDLNEILDKITDDFDLLIAQKKATVSHEKLPVIQAIPLQINQLFYNLLGNALKFTNPDIPPAITITSRILSRKEIEKFTNLNPESAYYEIIFADNGIGFSKSYSEQIFLIFHRSHMNNHFEGTGIGLALCKKIVLNHKGVIYAESQEKKGSSFHVILPAGQ